MIDHPCVDNQHCIISYRKDNHSVVLTDISQQGIYINNKKIVKESVQIRSGDVIKFVEIIEPTNESNLSPPKFVYKFNNCLLKRSHPIDLARTNALDFTDDIEQDDHKIEYIENIKQDELKICDKLEEKSNGKVDKSIKDEINMITEELQCGVCLEVVHNCVTLMPC